MNLNVSQQTDDSNSATSSANDLTKVVQIINEQFDLVLNETNSFDK